MNLVAPAITNITPNQVVVEGSILTLDCVALGTPPLKVIWTKEGGPDVSAPRYIIVNTTRRDQGVYRCTVKITGNECPAATATVNVDVNCE